MPSLSDIRRRITSVKNTRKITRAMKLVSSAKLKKAKDAATAAQPYQQTLQRVLERVVASVADIEHPLLTVPDNENDVLVVYIGSDRGLCGGFNSQLLKATTNRRTPSSAAAAPRPITRAWRPAKSPARIRARAKSKRRRAAQTRTPRVRLSPR